MNGEIHFSDHLEERLAQAMDAAGVEYIHESEDKNQQLDFFLPFEGVYIEVKQYYSERSIKQMAGDKDVIMLQGKRALSFFNILLNRIPNDKRSVATDVDSSNGDDKQK